MAFRRFKRRRYSRSGRFRRRTGFRRTYGRRRYGTKRTPFRRMSRELVSYNRGFFGLPKTKHLKARPYWKYGAGVLGSLAGLYGAKQAMDYGLGYWGNYLNSPDFNQNPDYGRHLNRVLDLGDGYHGLESIIDHGSRDYVRSQNWGIPLTAREQAHYENIARLWTDNDPITHRMINNMGEVSRRTYEQALWNYHKSLEGPVDPSIPPKINFEL